MSERLTVIAASWPDWGDAPTWFAAILAFVAGGVAFRVYKIESDRDVQATKERAEREADADRAQALKVASWFAKDTGESDYTTTAYSAYVRNSSDLPVYDVWVTFYWVASGAPTVEVNPDRPRRGDLPVLPPGELKKVSLPSEVSVMLGDVRDEHYVTGIEFRDAAGASWKRDAHGVLIRLEGS